MAQFDVYVNESRIDPDAIPFLLDIQSDSLSELRTRIVAPLRLKAIVRPVSPRLNPVFEIADTEVVLMMHELLYLPTTTLGRRVGSLSDEHEKIMRALDFLTVGF